MSVTFRGWSLGVVSAIWLCATLPAAAETVDDANRGGARKLGYAGVQAYQAGDYAVASEKLEKSYHVLKAPSLGLWSARALVKLDRWVEASERYREVLRLDVSSGEAAVQKQAQADASSELEQLSPKIPSVVVRVQGAEPAEVVATIDGHAVAKDLLGEATPVNPGTHVVVGTHGAEKLTVQLVVAAGEEKQALLHFVSGAAASPTSSTAPLSTEPSAPNGPASDGSHGSTQRILGWSSLGVGGAMLIVGGVAGGLALGKKHDLDATTGCTQNACEKGGGVDAKVSSYNSLRTVSSAGFVVGGVLAATGVVLLLTAPKSNGTGMALFVAPAAAGLRGAF